MTVSFQTADLNSADVEELVELVWGAVLDAGVSGTDPLPDTAGFLVAAVDLLGDRPGVVTIACPEQLAARFAMRLFDIGNEHVTDADRRDALGEVANMSAGNLKALVPGANQLGLPVVVDGTPGLTPQSESRSWTFAADGITAVVRISDPAPERTPSWTS